jgi:hypothetical protein
MPLPLALERPEKERGFSAPLLERKHFDIKRESIMIIVRLLSPEPVGWLSTTQLYSGLGADIVMESITLIDPVLGQNPCLYICGEALA